MNIMNTGTGNIEMNYLIAVGAIRLVSVVLVPIEPATQTAQLAASACRMAPISVSKRINFFIVTCTYSSDVESGKRR